MERQPRQQTDRSRVIRATEMAGMWLHRGNLASERGDLALAERHYARAQKWHDEMNDLLGNGNGDSEAA